MPFKVTLVSGAKSTYMWSCNLILKTFHTKANESKEKHFALMLNRAWRQLIVLMFAYVKCLTKHHSAHPRPRNTYSLQCTLLNVFGALNLFFLSCLIQNQNKCVFKKDMQKRPRFHFSRIKGNGKALKNNNTVNICKPSTALRGHTKRLVSWSRCWHIYN